MHFYNNYTSVSLLYLNCKFQWPGWPWMSTRKSLKLNSHVVKSDQKLKVFRFLSKELFDIFYLEY